MLSHRNRFHGHGSLRYLYRNGSRSRNRDLGLHYINNSNRVHSRFAVVISKKIYKSAVKRNRLRRRIFEIIRLELDHIKSPYDYIITVFTPELLLIDQAKLRQQLLDLLAKDGLID